MSILLASAAVATAMLSNCSWNSPGRNPYRGSVAEAVSRYIDIPVPVRAQLIAKIEGGRADDNAAIMRDTIAGKYDYDSRITSMHFGQRTVCENVTRDGWAATAREPAKVYCVDDHCLIVPQVCGNISRVRRIAASGGGGGAPAAAPGAVPFAQAPQPGLVRAASPEDVAMADAMAQAASPEPMVATAAFASPFGATSRAPDLTDRNPGTDIDLTQPTSPVPEPATLGMLGAGLAIVIGAAQRRASRAARR